MTAHQQQRPAPQPIDALIALDDYALELDRLSRALDTTATELEPVAREHQEFIDWYELGLYDRSEREDGYKLPSEAMRQKLALRAMSSEKPALRGRYLGLTEGVKRAERRIRELRTLVEAQRSILSALKEEMSASGASTLHGRRAA